MNDPSWRGDLAKYASTYWPANAGRVRAGRRGARRGKDGAYTFHGRSDEVINVNGNRVGTEQIERRLWGVETPAAATATKTRAEANGVASAADGSTNGDAKEAAAAAGAKARAAGVGPGGGAGATSEWTVGDGFRVRDCCVVGAPDFVKGTAPVAFVVFEPKRGSKLPPGAVPDVNAFRAAAASTVAAGVGAYAAPDHVFAVDALPKTITNKTARKTLQLLLAGLDAPSGSLARREVLPPIASAVREWRLTGATTSQRVDLTRYWRQFTFDDHNVQGRPIVPGAGWLCLLAHEMGSERLADVAFMRGVHDADADVRVVKRRRVMQATVGDDVILRASTSSGAAAGGDRSRRVRSFRRAARRRRLGRRRRHGHRGRYLIGRCSGRARDGRLHVRAALPPVRRPSTQLRRRVPRGSQGGMVRARVSRRRGRDAPRRGARRGSAGGVRGGPRQHVHPSRRQRVSHRRGGGGVDAGREVRGARRDSRATPGISRRGREIRTRRREANRKREVAQRET